MFEIVKQILRAPTKAVWNFPQSQAVDRPLLFGDSKLSDILSFGFSYVEHEDHCVEYLLITPLFAKRVIKEIDSFRLTVDTEYLGMLWTAQVVLTDKILDNTVVFSNRDFPVVLSLNIKSE